MKHIKAIELHEARSESLSEQAEPIGFVMYFNAEWYYGAFYTFHAFGAAVWSHFIGDPIPPEDSSGEPTYFGDSDTLVTVLSDALSEWETPMDFDNLRIWWGMTPRIRPDLLMVHEQDGNPFNIAKALEKAFTNAKEVMDKDEWGNMEDPGYIGRSIVNEPALLLKYMDGNYTFTQNEIFKAVKAVKGWSTKELEALIKFQKIKGMI